MESGRKPVLRKDELDSAVTSFLLKENLPFNMLDSENFREFVNTLTGQENVLMCRATANKRMDSQLTEMKASLIKTLGEVEFVSVTADCWTSHHRSFLGMTCHFLSPELEMQSVALACRRMKGAHTFDKLAAAIDSVLREYHIQNKTLRIITDNASNFVKAFRVFGQAECYESLEDEEQEDSVTSVQLFPDEDAMDITLPPHHRCAAHTLNLVATKYTEAALMDATFKTASRSVFGKATALWNKQSRAVTSAEAIHQIAGRQLVVPNQTRWNSTFDAISCLHRIPPDVLEKICDAVGLPRFSSRDLDFIREFVLVMGPLSRCLDFLQGGKGVGLGCLLPQLETLKGRIESMKQSLVICRPLADSVLKGVDTRFAVCYSDRECLLAAVSDPRRKLSWTRDSCLQARSKSALNCDCMTQEPTTPTINKDDDDDFLSFEVVDNRSVTSYLSCPTGPLTMLDAFPKLKMIFVRYNSILPSSASVERLFSCAGLILTPNRARVSDDHFEARVLLKFNKKV